MLKNKNIIFLIIIVALAFVAWGFLRGEKLEEATKFPELKFNSKVDRIEINNNDQRSVLIKEDGDWLVRLGSSNFPADQAAIDAIVSVLDDFPFDEIVSQNEAKYAELGIQDVEALEVSWFRGDDEQGRIYFGRQNFQQQGDYVRVGDKVSVYITKQNIQFNFSRPDFRDLSLLKLDAAAISKIQLKYGEDGEQVTLEKTSQQQEQGEIEGVEAPPQQSELMWFVIKDNFFIEADQSAVFAYVGQVSNLVARNFIPIDDNKDYGMTEPYLEITVTANEKDYVVKFGDQADEEPAYYVAAPGKDEWIYLVHVSVVNDQLSKKAEDFQAEDLRSDSEDEI